MTSTHDGPAADSGIGIVEVVIAMFLLALLAAASLPLFVSALQLSNTGSTVTTATQLVDEQLTQARAQASTCGALTTFAATAVPSTTDGAGRTLVSSRTVSCPASYPGTARVTVTVRAGSSVVATAATLVYASAA